MLLENKDREPTLTVSLRRSINRIIFVENESAHVKRKLLTTRETYGPRNITRAIYFRDDGERARRLENLLYGTLSAY